MKFMGQFFTAIVVGIPLTLWKAYCFQILWSWFVVPAFGLPELHIAQIGGMFSMITLIAFKTYKDDRGFGEKMFELIGYGVTLPLICLGFGAVYRLFL